MEQQSRRAACGHLVAIGARPHICRNVLNSPMYHTTTYAPIKRVTSYDPDFESSWDLAWNPASAWVHPPRPTLLRSLWERLR